jgi:hypothetical protein
MLLEKEQVSKGKLSFFTLAVADIPLERTTGFDLLEVLARWIANLSQHRLRNGFS